MTQEERKLFDDVVDKFKEQYPRRNITVRNAGFGDELVNVDGEDKFNLTGYNLLYNLQRLCGVLADELI